LIKIRSLRLKTILLLMNNKVSYCRQVARKIFVSVCDKYILASNVITIIDWVLKSFGVFLRLTVYRRTLVRTHIPTKTKQSSARWSRVRGLSFASPCWLYFQIWLLYINQKVWKCTPPKTFPHGWPDINLLTLKIHPNPSTIYWVISFTDTRTHMQ